MTVYIRAEDIQIDSDEDGWNLTVTDEASGKSICINFQALALEFYDNVRHTLGPYAAEANEARETASRIEAYLAMPRRIDTPIVSVEDAIADGYAYESGAEAYAATDPDPLAHTPEWMIEDSGYEPDDPKSPGYHERMVD